MYTFLVGCINSYALFAVHVYPGGVISTTYVPMSTAAPMTPLRSNGTC